MLRRDEQRAAEPVPAKTAAPKRAKMVKGATFSVARGQLAIINESDSSLLDLDQPSKHGSRRESAAHLSPNVHMNENNMAFFAADALPRARAPTERLSLALKSTQKALDRGGTQRYLGKVHRKTSNPMLSESLALP